MKKPLAFLLLFVAQLLAANVAAQPVTQADADRLFDFAEELDPGLFAPPVATQSATVAESDWFLRFYTGSSLYLAINVNGAGPFLAGDVYALGGPFGDAPALVGQLATLLAYLDSLTADDDNDGVINTEDQCPGSASGVPVNGQGCSAQQLGIVVLQDDADTLFHFAEQLDAAAFGPPAATQVVNELGVQWYKRSYGNTGISILVSINGVDSYPAGNVYVSGGPFGQDPVFIDTLANLVAFIDSQVPADDDKDGVPNDSDLCAATPAGASVNGQGCSQAQLDDDGDGVNNAADQCPATPAGEAADLNGCSASQNNNNGGESLYIIDQGSGACGPVVLPPKGLVARYRTVLSTDEGNFVLERTEEWLAISETEIKTRDTQVTTTAVSSSESVSTTTQTYDFANGLVFLTEMFVQTTDTTTLTGLPVPIPPQVTELESTLVFDPFQFLYPQSGYCEGMVLFHPSVTETTFNDPPGVINPIVGQTGEFTVQVISVAEQVSVEAGGFNTIHLREVDEASVEEATVDVWLDRETGILVKMEIRDNEGTLSATTELTEVTYP